MDMLIAKMKYNYYTILGSKNYPYHKSKERNYSTCQISTNEVEQNEKTIYKATMGQVEKNEMLFFFSIAATLQLSITLLKNTQNEKKKSKADILYFQN